MEALIVGAAAAIGYALGYFVRGYRSVTLEDIAKAMEAADRDEPIAERVRRASRSR